MRSTRRTRAAGWSYAACVLGQAIGTEHVVYKFEATRILLQHLESKTASSHAIIEAMLAEVQTKLAVDIDLSEMQAELESADELRRNWLRAKRAWAEPAQAACEPRGLGAPQDMGPASESTSEVTYEIERMAASGRFMTGECDAERHARVPGPGC